MRPHQHHRRHSKIATFDGAVVEFEPSGSDGRSLLINLTRAILARILLIVHSLATIWQAVAVHRDNSVWSFALISVAILIEGGYAVIMRAGDEKKWFSICSFLYILSTAPPIWMLETEMCKLRLEREGQESRERNDSMEEIRLQLLEQLLLVVLILNRWLLPKGRSVSREQLSQILLAYLAISSDIVEFFDVFKERTVYSSTFLQRIVLYVWTLSLLQFPFVLTVSRARKMRLALTNEEVILDRNKGMWQVIYDVDMWAILLANSLQDIPFLAVRLYLIFARSIFTYTMAFFTCKNALIIFLQTYRAFVLFNDRYLHPKSILLNEPTRRCHPSKARRRNRHRRNTKIAESENTALTFLDVELRTLLKFVPYLANDPVLKIRTLEDLLDTPEKIIIKNWVEERSFSRFEIASFTSTDQRYMENQFQKADTTYIIEDVSEDKHVHFLEERLKSGQLRLFGSDNPVFAVEVLERLIANYQQNPEDYTSGNYKIWVMFDKTTADQRLAEMAEQGLCEVVDGLYSFRSNTARTTFCVEYQVYEELYALWVDYE